MKQHFGPLWDTFGTELAWVTIFCSKIIHNPASNNNPMNQRHNKPKKPDDKVHNSNIRANNRVKMKQINK